MTLKDLPLLTRLTPRCRDVARSVFPLKQSRDSTFVGHFWLPVAPRAQVGSRQKSPFSLCCRDISQSGPSTKQAFHCPTEAMALWCEGGKQDEMYFRQNESFHSVYSKTLALFPITLHDSKSNSHSMTSLLRHHPSAVSCDDSDLLLEESCVMDISTEVKRVIFDEV